MDVGSQPPIGSPGKAIQRLSADTCDAGAWWTLGHSLAEARQWDAAFRAFQAAARLQVARRARGACIVVINTERRFVGHELPVFRALLARGEDALYFTSCPDSFEDLRARGAVKSDRVMLLPLTQDPQAYGRIDWTRVRAMVTASVKPCLATPVCTRAVFLTHDLVGFHRTDLPPLATQDADAQRCLAAYASFDSYVVGSEPAAVDLMHRVEFYRQQVPAPLARPRLAQPQQILRAGYPRLDAALREPTPLSGQGAVASTAERDVVLVAPTERGVSCGTWTAGELRDLLQLLVEAFPAHRVIFRPHPSEPARYAAEFTQLRQLLGARPNFLYDDAIPSPHWERASVMVTDTSGTAFTFAFTTLRPVVFFVPHDAKLRAAFPLAHALELREQLGAVATSLPDVRDRVERCLAGWLPGDLSQVRDRLVFHVGRSAAVIAEALAEPWPACVEPVAVSCDAPT